MKDSKKDIKSVVLVSGGLDSCVTAGLAISEGACAFLHMSYGQLTEVREKRSFTEIANYYGIEERLMIKVDFLKKIGGSSLTDKDIPLDSISTDSDKVPNTYVPFRNGIILSIATAYAERLGAENIYIGAVWEDSSGYPDCRPEFYKEFNKTIKEGTKPGKKGSIQIITPLIALTKAEIVKKGFELNAPLHLTWSCYQNSEIACGKCESCRLRLKGFRKAGFDDPIPYEDKG